MPFTDANGARLRYDDGGAGEGSPLLLIAGIPAIGNDWLPLAEPLRANRRVIAYDNRGSGESEVTPGPYSTAQLADDAAALLDALGAAPADVIGMSLGGMIAQELALRHPNRVRRLILGCTNSGFADAVQPEREVARAFATETESWAERIELLAPFAFARGVDEGFLERFVAKKSADPQEEEGYRGQVAAAVSHDATARLGEITAPTLVLTGDDDRVIPGANSERLAAAISGARLEVIAGAGHLFFLEQPDRTRRVLEEFLDDDITRFRSAFAAFARGDLDAALADVAPDFKLRDHVIPEDTEEPSGPEALRANHAQILEGFDDFSLEPQEFVEIDDGMLIRVRSTGHSDRGGGLDADLEVGQLWRLRDGLAVALDIYPTWEEARRAAGLEGGG